MSMLVFYIAGRIETGRDDAPIITISRLVLVAMVLQESSLIDWLAKEATFVDR